MRFLFMMNDLKIFLLVTTIIITSIQKGNTCECFAISESHVAGVSSNGKHFLVEHVHRKGDFHFDGKKTIAKCSYPKIKGKPIVGLDYYLCETGKECSSYTPYKIIDPEKGSDQCSSKITSNLKLKWVKKAAKNMNINFNAKGKKLSSEEKILKQDESNSDNEIKYKVFIVPESIMKAYGIDSKLIIDLRTYDPVDSDSPHVDLKVKIIADKYGELVIETFSCSHMCPMELESASLYTKNRLILYNYTTHCGLSHHKGIDLLKKSSELLNLRGLSFHSNKKYKESLADFKKAFTVDPSNVRAAFNTACAYSRLNKKNDALKYLKKAISLNSKYKAIARKDSDFKKLRRNPQFQELVKKGILDKIFN